MKLNEPPQNFEFKNTLSSLRLPINPNNIPHENKKNGNNSLNKNIDEMKNLLKDMKLNEHRTTNFATIIYIEENNFEKTPLDTIKLKLRKDFNINKNMLVNSKNNTPFESERNLIQSMHASISRNKSFITEIINNKKYVSLNQPKALEYLQKMYGKYTTNYNGDITSMASLESKKKKSYFNLSSNSKNNSVKSKNSSINLIGNKTLRSSSRIRYEEILSDEEEENIKYLKDNLREKKPNSNKSGKKGKNEKITDFFGKNLNFKTADENAKKYSLSSYIQEIDKSINSLNLTEKIISSYKAKLKDLKPLLQGKEEKIKDYEKEKSNLNSKQNQLNVLYDIMVLKLGTIQSTKKHKYYGEFFPKAKNMSLNYKIIFDQKINDIKKNISHIHSIKADIINKNKAITDRVKKINDVDNEISYLAKNEIKKDFSNFLKKLRIDNKGIDILCDDFDNNDNNTVIEELKKKFNDIAQEITEEKEDFD